MKTAQEPDFSNADGNADETASLVQSERKLSKMILELQLVREQLQKHQQEKQNQDQQKQVRLD